MPRPNLSSIHQRLFANAQVWVCGLSAIISFILLMQLDLEPRHFADNYFIKAKLSFWDPTLYTTERPFGIYWFYKIAGYDPVWVVRLQNLLSALAWAFLGYVLAAPFRNQLLVSAIILGTSLAALSWTFAGWHTAMLTESLVATTFALFCAAFLLFQRKPCWLRFLGLLACAFFLGVLRDTLPFFLVAFSALVWLLAWRDREAPKLQRPFLRRFLVFSVLLLAFSSWSAQMGLRHVFSLNNVMFQRILPNPTYAAWFEAQGMPLALLTDGPHHWEAQWASSYEMALYKDLRYMPYHQWAFFEGKSHLARFLLSHPRYVWQGVWQDRAEIFRADLSDYTGQQPTHLIVRLATLLWRDVSLWLLLPLGLVYLYLVWTQKVSPVPLVIAIAAVSNAVLAYHADAMEVTRHCLFTRWALLIATWHALLLVLNFAIGQWKQGVKVNDSSATT